MFIDHENVGAVMAEGRLKELNFSKAELPEVGTRLKALQERVIENPALNTSDQLLKLLVQGLEQNNTPQ